MGTYSDSLERAGYEIWPGDEQYTEKLRAVAESFCTFDAALDRFLREHGYSGDPEDTERKLRFLRERFAAGGVPEPRNMRKWYTEHRRIERGTAFQICFAFGLTPEDTEDFLRRICLQRGFDFHDADEIVLYFCLRYRLPYGEAKELQEEARRRMGARRPERIDFSREVYYTGEIRKEAELLTTREALMRYLGENRERFIYHHATAGRYIRELWREIAGEFGLAAEERKRLYPADPEGERLSLWSICLQILGLSRRETGTSGAERTLKPFLKKNPFLHTLAQESFPDRDGLTKILNGGHVSHERARKDLILLTFYQYWVRLALKRSGYQAEPGDGERCVLQMDHYLTDAGYPELYVGNPYDWIFLYAAVDDYPLIIFREMMRGA